MTDQELDRLMERVLLDSLKSDCGTPAEDLAFVPSSQYQKQMKDMLANPLSWERRRNRPAWRRWSRRIAAILLAASVTFGSLMALSPTAWASVMRWVTEWYETHIIYRYSGDQLTGELPQYEITALPEGYVENERVEWFNYCRISYQNEGGREISLSYTYMEVGTTSYFETEQADVESITVNGQDGILVMAQNQTESDNAITWIDSDSNIQFTIDACFGADEMKHLAETVLLVNSRP